MPSSLTPPPPLPSAFIIPTPRLLCLYFARRLNAVNGTVRVDRKGKNSERERK